MLPNTNLTDSNAKLLRLAKSLSKKEWIAFGDFVKSPFYNKQERIVLLYKVLNRKFPFDQAIYKSDLLPILGIKKRYPKHIQLSKKEDARLRKGMNTFSQLLQDFLLTTKSKEFTSYNSRLLIDALMERKLYDLIPQVLRKGQVGQEDSSISIRHYHEKYLLDEAAFYLQILSENRSKKMQLQNTIDNFQHYCLCNLLLYFSAAINRERILKIQYNYPLLAPILSFVGDHYEKFEPLVKVYYHTLLLQMEVKTSFSTLKKLMTTFGATFDKTTQRHINNFLINNCIREIREGNESFRMEKHEIYRANLPTRIWDSGLYFSAHHFILIVRNALAIGEWHWSTDFVQDYEAELENSFLPDLPNLAKAYLYFFSKDYSKAADYLLQINTTTDFFYTLYLRILWIQIHYENSSSKTETSTLVAAALQALRAFLKRNQNMSSAIKESNQNFMKMMERLFRIKQNLQYSKDAKKLLIRLRNDIQVTSLLNERDWLRQKVEELVVS